MLCVLAVLLVATGCGETVDASRPLTEINACVIQSHSAPSFMTVGAAFEEMQEMLRTMSAAELPEPLRSMRQMVEERASFDDWEADFEPEAWEGAYEEGQTSLSELVYLRGFRAASDFVSDAYFGLRIVDQEDPELGGRIGLNLEFECEAFDISAIEFLCESSPSQGARDAACRDLPRIPDRDMTAIAEVCEQVPYFLVCQPDDPPPMTLEEAAERNGEG